MSIKREEGPEENVLILTIRRASVEDSGTYECLASNTHGSNSAHYELHVQG